MARSGKTGILLTAFASLLLGAVVVDIVRRAMPAHVPAASPESASPIDRPDYFDGNSRGRAPVSSAQPIR
ncbi:MAG: hypothetical protein AABY85_05445 [Gemmatimonadota bacterium]